MVLTFGTGIGSGMLVDGAIVVVEYADKRIQEGTGPMHAFVEAAKRMFWPVVSSTATIPMRAPASKEIYFFFLWRSLRKRFLRLCVAIFCRFLFLPLPIVSSLASQSAGGCSSAAATSAVRALEARNRGTIFAGTR